MRCRPRLGHAARWQIVRGGPVDPVARVRRRIGPARRLGAVGGGASGREVGRCGRERLGPILRAFKSIKIWLFCTCLLDDTYE